MTEVYRAGGQLLKVRAFMLVSLAAALASSWYGWDLFQTFGLRPADGGVLAPLGTRLAWGLSVASLGIIFAAGMWAYGRVYVSAMRFDEAADMLHVRTVGFIGGRDTIYPARDVLGSTYHEGRLDNDEGDLVGVTVDAPWITLRMAGKSWPLIVDAQGEFPDRALAARLFVVS